MRRSLLGISIVLFLALGVASVYANPDGNLGLPILGTTGVPALAAPSLFSGVITVLHADGTPVVLETNVMDLDLCSASSCTSVTATLKQTAPGTFTYSFTPPSLTGTVTIYVKANALADDNGRVFPSVDTSIGTYAYAPSTTMGSSVPSAPAGNPSIAPALSRQAVNTNPASTVGPSPLEPLLVVLSVLAVAGSLLVFSKRH